MLRVEGLSKSFGGNVALNDVSFTLRGGELTSVIGPNGAGKTTLLDGISGLVALDSGRIFLNDEDISTTTPWIRSKKWIDRTFQKIRLTSTLTAEENVMLHVRGQSGAGVVSAVVRRRNWRNQEQRIRAKAGHLLSRLSLDAHAATLAGRLSFGQRKLVSFCGVLASELPVLLLDEPFTGLDPTRISEVSKWLLELAGRGTVVLFVEHNLGVVSGIADRVLALDRGCLIADGPPQTVLQSDELKAAYLR